MCICVCTHTHVHVCVCSRVFACVYKYAAKVKPIEELPPLESSRDITCYSVWINPTSPQLFK